MSHVEYKYAQTFFKFHFPPTIYKHQKTVLRNSCTPRQGCPHHLILSIRFLSSTILDTWAGPEVRISLLEMILGKMGKSSLELFSGQLLNHLHVTHESISGKSKKNPELSAQVMIVEVIWARLTRHVLLPSLEVIVKKTVLFFCMYCIMLFYHLIFSSSHQPSRIQSPHPQKR